MVFSSENSDISPLDFIGTFRFQEKWLQSLGTVSNLNIYSRKLSNGEMLQRTGGPKCLDGGDLMAWADMEWDLVGADIETYPLEGDICSELNTWKFSLQTLVSWAGCKASCAKESHHSKKCTK